MQGKPQNHKPTNTVYRKAILKAIEDLHDCHLRSNVDAIRRHTMSQLEANDHHSWNEVVFMKTLKCVIQDGEVEQHTYVNCALSPEYKRRRADSLNAYMMEHQNNITVGSPGGAVVVGQQQQQVPCVPDSNNHPALVDSTIINHNNLYPNPHAAPSQQQQQTAPPQQQQHPGCESPKLAPKRKAEHDKYKIMPKLLFDQTM